MKFTRLKLTIVSFFVLVYLASVSLVFAQTPDQSDPYIGFKTVAETYKQAYEEATVFRMALALITKEVPGSNLANTSAGTVSLRCLIDPVLSLFLKTPAKCEREQSMQDEIQNIETSTTSKVIVEEKSEQVFVESNQNTKQTNNKSKQTITVAENLPNYVTQADLYTQIVRLENIIANIKNTTTVVYSGGGGGYSTPVNVSPIVTSAVADALLSQTSSTLSTSTVRGFISTSATGLTYSSSTGDIALTSGYTIPLTASTTEWANKTSSQWTTSGLNVYYNTGNVGVGSSTPHSKLSVTGTTTIDGTLVIGNLPIRSSVINSLFVGNSAGSQATAANNSNFLGASAGYQATNAYYSNFLGASAGYQATNAYNSNFLGQNAGNGATNAYYNNFFGSNAGREASSTSHANFFGSSAGYGATNAEFSNFFGPNAGYQATAANNSNFFGSTAGYQATAANSSNFFGSNAGREATAASYSNFLGHYAGYQATAANNSNFFGSDAGNGATAASQSNFLGYYAGFGATDAAYSNLFGSNAGYQATAANYSNFFGSTAGYGATNASESNFLGPYAGYQATAADTSNFLGPSAGFAATNANNSNFFGPNAGNEATNASYSSFIGTRAGYGSQNAAHSIFMGRNAGNVNNTVDTTFVNNLIIDQGLLSTGPRATAADIQNNALLYGTFADTASNQQLTVNGQLNASAGGAIYAIYAIGNIHSTASISGNTLDIDYFGTFGDTHTATLGDDGVKAAGFSDGTNIVNLANNTYAIDATGNIRTSGIYYGNTLEVASVYSTGSYYINGTPGVTCTNETVYSNNGIVTQCSSSDSRFKKNVHDVEDILGKIELLKPVTYEWNDLYRSRNNLAEDGAQYGFIAQDLKAVFPEFVNENEDGYFSIKYAQITSVLTKAVQEIWSKVKVVLAWFSVDGSKFKVQGDVCVDDICVTKEQFKSMLMNAGGTANIQQSIPAGGGGQSFTDSASSTATSSSSDSVVSGGGDQTQTSGNGMGTTTEPTGPVSETGTDSESSTASEVVESAPAPSPAPESAPAE